MKQFRSARQHERSESGFATVRNYPNFTSIGNLLPNNVLHAKEMRIVEEEA